MTNHHLRKIGAASAVAAAILLGVVISGGPSANVGAEDAEPETYITDEIPQTFVSGEPVPSYIDELGRECALFDGLEFCARVPLPSPTPTEAPNPRPATLPLNTVVVQNVDILTGESTRTDGNGVPIPSFNG